MIWDISRICPPSLLCRTWTVQMLSVAIFQGCRSPTFQERFVLAIFGAYLRAPHASLCPMKVTEMEIQAPLHLRSTLICVLQVSGGRQYYHTPRPSTHTQTY